MEVQVREKCQDCEDGYVYSEAWRLWNERFAVEESRIHREIHGGAIPSDEDLSLARQAIEAWELANPAPDHYEMLRCPECEGTTWLYRWVPVEALVKGES